jgi:bifunctional non-homologous end joining protein LigD
VPNAAADLRPMLASLIDAPLQDPQFVYEPKYDGIRAIVEIANGRARLWSRLGNEKTRQFPEIAAALEHWAASRTDGLVLDGEIVALDAHGEPAGFQQLQGRMHLEHLGVSSSAPSPHGVAFIAFDLLREGSTDLRDRPLVERRAALERVYGRAQSPLLRLSEIVRGEGRELYRRAMDSGWEGVIAKRTDSKYRSGKRTPDWRKLKIVREQEFVVGGWTEPRDSRVYFGSLILGVYESSHQPPATSHRLVYVGQVGTGFDERELARLMKLLKPLETKTCPFAETPQTNERPHWVKPKLVAQVKFTEWTNEGRLRHPVYLGLRDDKKPKDIRREETSRLNAGSQRVSNPRTPNPEPRTRNPEPGTLNSALALVDRLRAIEESKHDGVIEIAGAGHLKVTNLHKVFWPALKLTKGDVFRYYARVAPVLLPVIADRPLVMKRFPNGVSAKPFYQHRAPDKAPEGVREEMVGGAERRPQIIGGDLETLLYTTQLAAISQDPWFSRVQHPGDADHVALDLDPAPGVPFARVLDVARWIRDELSALGAIGFPKTSGADGLHVYVPLPPGTPYGVGLIFCQIVATVVVQKHAKTATTERAVRSRGPRVYIDCLQNMMGKTLASAYSLRASEYAGVSTPLSWKEVDEGVDRQEFTIKTVPARIEEVGDLWAPLRASKGVDLDRVARGGQEEVTGD